MESHSNFDAWSELAERIRRGESDAPFDLRRAVEVRVRPQVASMVAAEVAEQYVAAVHEEVLRQIRRGGLREGAELEAFVRGVLYGQILQKARGHPETEEPAVQPWARRDRLPARKRSPVRCPRVWSSFRQKTGSSSCVSTCRNRNASKFAGRWV